MNPETPSPDSQRPESPWVTRLELARLLRVSLSTVDRLIATGEIPFHRVRVRAVRFLRQDVEQYLRQHRKTEPTQIKPGASGATTPGPK